MIGPYVTLPEAVTSAKFVLTYCVYYDFPQARLIFIGGSPAVTALPCKGEHVTRGGGAGIVTAKMRAAGLRKAAKPCPWPPERLKQASAAPMSAQSRTKYSGTFWPASGMAREAAPPGTGVTQVGDGKLPVCEFLVSHAILGELSG